MEKLIDTHCHLNDEFFEGKVEEIVNNFEFDNLKNAFVVGYDFDSCLKAVELANKYEKIYAIIGMHPSDCETWNLKFENFLVENLKKQKSACCWRNWFGLSLRKHKQTKTKGSFC